ncbi:MAG: TRAP transporter substrate-binding protein DctP [Oscillibacter sp.]|nr:TRAP transporter substrate-binding protein DctP [Oscillibacter sp.]
MKNMKKFLSLALALVMASSLVACGSTGTGNGSASKSDAASSTSTEPITISISHSYTELDQVSVELNTAAENIKERTNGVVTVNLYPNNTFGSLTDGVEAVTAGSPLLLMAAYSQWEDLCYDASALQCGFVFESGQEFLDVMQSDLFTTLVGKMDAAGVHPLNCAFVGGMRQVIGKKPYTTPEAIKGLKLRVPNSTTYLECFEALGASPIGMAASEQMSALSAGTIDALDQSISLMYSTKSYEMVNQVTMLNQQPLADALFCNAEWWNSIPEEYRTIIEEELHDAGIRYNEYSVENEGTMRKEMEAAGVEFHDVDREAFMELGGDLVLKYSIGQELLDTLAEIRANAN